MEYRNANKKGDYMRIDRIKFAAVMAKSGKRGKDIAEIAGVSMSSVYGVKQGRSCSAEMASKIASALNVPLNELLEKEQ